MKALRFERSVPRLAAARAAGAIAPGRAARLGALRLVDEAVPAPPGPGWHRLRPRLAGICGSDLATVGGRSSRWFEPVVSFPFVPGHEVVGDLDDGARVVLEPVLGCAARGIDPPCAACARRDVGRCTNVTKGELAPGLQTGYCADTGGGWSLAMVAHAGQLHPVPDDVDDESAVMVEPAACAIRGALRASGAETVAVLGAGTLGLCTVAALARWVRPGHLVVTAKHPEQRRRALDLGASVVVEPNGLTRAVRRANRSLATPGAGPHALRLPAGADVAIDCVGRADSVSQALAVVRTGGRIVMLGMPGQTNVDLTPLWQQEIELVGSYTYGVEPAAGGRATFEMAFELVMAANLGRLTSATYPLERYTDALAHAAEAGRRGAAKVAFDLRDDKERDRL